MILSLRMRLLPAVLLPLCAARLHAQAPDPVVSRDQPSRGQPYAAVLALGDRGGDAPAAHLLACVHHPILNPVTGLLGAAAEVYATTNGPFSGGGLRALATSRVFALAAGA